MYDLNQDAIINKPKLFGEYGLRPLYSLEQSQKIVIEFFEKYYDFDKNLKDYIKKVKNCKEITNVEYYLCNSLIAGLKLKSKINMAKIYKANN